MLNMKCSTSLLPLILFIASIMLGYKCRPFLKQEQRTPQFDYLKLVFVWPNSFCSVARYGKCKTPVPSNNFTLHGFWPEKNNRKSKNRESLEYCSNAEMPDHILDNLKPRLEKTWPDLLAWNWEQSKGFYKRQWSKHGTCSESKLGQKEYLETALNLGEKYNLYNILKNNKRVSIVPDPTKLYSTDDIWKAVDKRLRNWPDVKCNTRPTRHGDEYQLFEIHLCYKFEKAGESEELVKTNCDGVVRCDGEKDVYYPNTYTTAFSFVRSNEEL